MKKIGIYGGSFDPVHHGHLILAREALETLQLAEMIFIPAAQSPHKHDRQPAPAHLRWEMLESAVANEPGFVASRLELDRHPPSYSVETLEALRAQQPEAEFYFLIGQDNLAKLPEWHRFNDLRRLVQFIVLDRSALQIEYPYPTIRRMIDISATAIRKRVASGRSIRYLVPETVERTIHREKLYQGNTQSNLKS
ncbi:MAG TPA: nicotinate-nucleotide adenylyltransferase [Chthoniobacterales bacterium]